jgi:hypothetical protein
MKKVPLTQLSRELAATYDGRTVPGYRKLWMMVVSGELPADQNTNGRSASMFIPPPGSWG